MLGNETLNSDACCSDLSKNIKKGECMLFLNTHRSFNSVASEQMSDAYSKLTCTLSFFDIFT